MPPTSYETKNDIRTEITYKNNRALKYKKIGKNRGPQKVHIYRYDDHLKHQSPFPAKAKEKRESVINNIKSSVEAVHFLSITCPTSIKRENN